jgi:hypothetical protein
MSCETILSILKLATPLIFKEGEGAVSSVTLPEADDNFEAGNPAVISGWGSTTLAGSTSNVLMAADVEINSDAGIFCCYK